MSAYQIGNLLIWGSDIEQGTLDQAAKTSRLPFISSHVALMPDAHVGIGSTVGTVIATKGAIVPAAIGVDIGCGMAAMKMPFDANLLPGNLDKLHRMIADAVPAGVGKSNDVRSAVPFVPFELSDKQMEKAQKQMGSLGAGNHFVEVCLDEHDYVWLMLHSGSRGIGNELAKVHIDGAKGLMKKYFIELEDPDLAYLTEGTDEFAAYIKAMLWAQDYALKNRQTMLNAAMRAFCAFMAFDFEPVETVNCHHNFTQLEHHHGKDVWLTRKGAISAREGQLGIIPGSMATGSYIVRGLGNAASYNSCSHGAGRKLSRSAARKQLTAETLSERMVGKSWNDRDAKALVDEHPDAYKSIENVMSEQKDLVEIVHTLRSLLNYKGVK